MEMIEKFELGKFLTFESSKNLPIYNWFYYKEAFSPQFVEWAIRNFYSEGTVLDPFCGIGTTNLFCKMNGIDSVGIDVSPIALLSSRVKCSFDLYDLEELSLDIQKLEREIKKKEEKEKGEWYFELFPPSRAFPRGYDKDIINIKSRIEEIDNELNRELFLLALLSIIPQSSLVIKDGGVLRISKKKVAIPPKIIFLRKIKKMYNDLLELSEKKEEYEGVVCKIVEGDARKMDLDEKISLIITSPPYLNNVDYTKVYGLELSLIESPERIKEIRKRAFRSFLDRDIKSIELNDEVRKVLDKRFTEKVPLIVYAYFSDCYKFLKECQKVLDDGKILMVISNSFIYGLSIEVDEILAELSQELCFKPTIYVGQVRKTKIGRKLIAARESVLALSKI
jgi:DNA modification methylase